MWLRWVWQKRCEIERCQTRIQSQIRCDTRKLCIGLLRLKPPNEKPPSSGMRAGGLLKLLNRDLRIGFCHFWCLECSKRSETMLNRSEIKFCIEIPLEFVVWLHLVTKIDDTQEIHCVVNVSYTDDYNTMHSLCYGNIGNFGKINFFRIKIWYLNLSKNYGHKKLAKIHLYQRPQTRRTSRNDFWTAAIFLKAGEFQKIRLKTLENPM